jgi:signal transduction histidine kinase
LTGIRQLGEMLLRGRVPDEARRQEYYGRITQESARLSRLVENLLQAAQLDEGRRQQRAERIETTAWLQAVIEETRTQPAMRHATIEGDIPKGLPALMGDRQALSSAMHNLIDNAVKYSPGGAPVRIEARREGNHLAIHVRDSGVGMSDEDRRHVFERFRRGRDPITQQIKGSGLGLSLVHDIVRAQGGHIACESRFGQGTTFSIRLAATRDEG